MFKRVKKCQKGGYSTQGYKSNSPDRNNLFNIIPSSNITMKGVDHPVMGIDATGFQQLMVPGQDYKFNSEHVLEIPIKQQGGLWSTNKKGFVDSTLQANKHLDFVNRLYNGVTPIQVPGQPYLSTHLMSYDPESRRVFPEVVNQGGKLKYLGRGNAPYDYADRTGEYIEFNTPEQAAWFSNSPNNKSGYKMGTNVLNNIEKGIPVNKKQQGGMVDPRLFNPGYVEPPMQAPRESYRDDINPQTVDVRNRDYRNAGNPPQLTNLQPMQFNSLGQPPKERSDTNLSFLPSYANSIASLFANKVSNNRERNYQMTNLSNPLNYIPQVDNPNDYQNYGTPSYQEGGEVDGADSDYEDFQDEEFLYGDDTPAATAQIEAPPTTAEEVAPEEPDYVLPIDESSQIISDGEVAQSYEGAAPETISRAEASGSASAREMEATNYLIQKGLPEHVAAGIVGNLKQESDLNPSAVQQGGNGRGIAQWDVRDRFQNLKSFAAKSGRPVNDLHTQLDYLLHEADSRGDLNKIKAATNPSEAAYLFAKHFEKPKTIEQVRMRNAERIFKNRRP